MTCHLFRSREQVRNPPEQVLHLLFDDEKERRGALLVIAWLQVF